MHILTKTKVKWLAKDILKRKKLMNSQLSLTNPYAYCCILTFRPSHIGLHSASKKISGY